MINRRTFGKVLGAGAAPAAATLAGWAGPAPASAAQQAPGTKAAAPVSGLTPAKDASFDTVKQINAGVLNVGYADVGPANGPAVILLHGWPYDIHSYAAVTPSLAAAGFRVIVQIGRAHV